MLLKLIVISFFFSVLAACASKRSSPISNENAKKEQVNLNNKVIVKNQNTQFQGTSEDKIIFKGENNLIEINTDSSTFKSMDSKNVMIIEGNQNNYIFNQKGLNVDSKNSQDTVVLKGNEQKSIITTTDFQKTTFDSNVSITKKQNGTELTFTEKKEDEIEEELEDFEISVNSNELIYIPELEDEIPAGEAILFYIHEANKGNQEANFKLGSFYQHGIGCKRNIQKALEHYELAARKNHSEAQFTLGEIYEFGLKEIKANKEKAHFYYTMAAKTGHKLSIEKLNNE